MLGHVLIIADKENQGLYHSLSLRVDNVEVCGLSDEKAYLNPQKAGILLLDCGSQACRGLRILRKIKANCPSAMVIFLTDLSSEDVVLNAFRAGVREYFRKPVRMAEVRSALHGLLKIREASQEQRSRYVSQINESSENFVCMQAETTDMPPNMLSVINFIEDNLSAPLSLDHLAQKAHLSKYHFCRLFKNHTGLNPIHFVNAAKIEKAKELLAKEHLTVSLVASEVGFNDTGSFIRMFKKLTDVTPSLYKKNLQPQPQVH